MYDLFLSVPETGGPQVVEEYFGLFIYRCYVRLSGIDSYLVHLSSQEEMTGY